MNTVIKKGSLLIYRVYDVAEEVNLKKVEEILRSRSGESRVRLAERARDAVVVRDAPVRMSLGEIAFLDRELPVEKASLYVTVWDYGTISVSWHLPLKPDLSWEELVAISSAIHWKQEIVATIDHASEARVKEVIEFLKPAFQRPSLWNVSEDYTIFYAQELSGVGKAENLLLHSDIARLLVGESQEKLAPSTAQSILDNVYQYSDNDLCVIDWNSAFVLEPGGQREIPDVLEFALTHLLEVRFYDDLIDKRLADLYHSVEISRQRTFYKSGRALSIEANTRYIEFTEFMERMGNSLKVVGDFYLARLFRGAIRRFRISDWEESITRKMNLLARVSELLQGEANVRRSHLLEIIIIILIAFEIMTPLFKGLWDLL